MSIFAHLTRNIYRKFLKLGAQIRQRMEEKAKSLKKACYELDTDYPSLFSMVNGARFIKKDGVELVTLDMVKDHDGEYSDWTITIEQGQKIGEVMDRIPFGVLNKTITGLGATTLEITNQERDSIIVVPTKSLAYGKYKSANNHFGDGYAFYFGSPIKEIRSAVKPAQVKNYLDSNNQWKKKFLVVADSLPRLIEILDSYNIDVYNSYFLMVDEIDTMQADSAYRPRLEYVMDYYFKFNQKFRSAVSATLNDFSNPKMEYESKIVTRWRENPRRNIDLIYTNYVDDTAVKIITQKLSENTDAKILIAYNSLDGILNILELLKKRNVDGVNNSNCGILCSERNNDKVKEYIEDADNVISEDANLQKRIVFMTCAYFAGIDIQDRCHLITITSHLQPFTYLSTQRMEQIAGRCRNGNLSETIIYDIPQNIPKSHFRDKEKYKNSLLSRADVYAEFMNSTMRVVENNPELKELGKFIDSFVDYSAKSKVTNADYPIKIIRKSAVEKCFVPSYFNIDALVEKWHLAYSLYTDRQNLYQELLSQGHEIRQLDGYCMRREKHDSSAIIDIKARNKEYRAERVRELRPLLLNWSQGGRNEMEYQKIYKSQDKQIQNLCHEFKKLSPYIDNEILFDGLAEKYENKQLCRKYLEMAEKTKKSFDEKFYNEEKHCLYDVLGDSKVRPNQLFALSLSHPIVDNAEIAEQILSTVENKLLNKYGLKTLSSDEDGYVDVYEGSAYKRDSSYHQGITWPWLLGLYYDALKNTMIIEKNRTKRQELEEKITKLVYTTKETFKAEMFERSSIGTISEIYDSTEPYEERGAFAQAWSVAEIFRIVLNKR